MQINLPIQSFSFFKVISGTIFLLIASFFPLFGYITLAVVVAGKAHSLGAWLSMWRAGKLNNVYFIWLIIITVGFSFWGIKIASLAALSFITYLFFAFHFIYDEFDLQEQRRTWNNLMFSVSPILLLFIFLVRDFYGLAVSFSALVLMSFVLFLLELVYIKEINWLFVQTKVLTLFILYMFFLGQSSITTLNIFLIFHYLFWFIYPVYKLHKYKTEERDGLIMVLIIIMLMSTFVYSSRVWGGVDTPDAIRLFLIASMIHVLSTAPFGYLFGLPKPKVL